MHTTPPAVRGMGRTLAMTLLAVASAALLVLAGCASPAGIAPANEKIEPQRLGLAADAAMPQVAPDWWKAFGDPELDGIVERALADNPNLQSAAARVERARAAVAGASAAEQPTVRLDGSVNRQRYSENYIYPPPLGGSMRNDGTLRAAFSWNLDLFGRERALLDAAVGTQRAAEADREAARVLLASNVVRGYVALARAVAQRDVAQRALEQREALLALIRQRVDAGLDTNVELRQGEGNVPDARLQIAQYDEQIALARHQLAALAAQPVDAYAQLTPALSPVRLAAVPERLGADLLGRRPDIAAARWRIEAATRDVSAARAQFYPDVNLVAFAGFTAIGLDNVLEAGSREFGIGPAITLPIFDAGRLRANLRGRAADVDAAVGSYNTALVDAVREVADQVTTLQAVDRQQREQADAQRSAESAYDLAVQRYRAGLGTYLVVLNAETTLLAQQRQAADLKARALDTQAQLMRSLGGGWQEPKEYQG